MQEVNIYIETSTIAPRATKSTGMYVMEAYEDGKPMMYKGEPVIVYDMMQFEHCNTNIITLTLLTAALERMQKDCIVHIHTRTEHVYWTLKNDWLGGWKKNGWKSARGVAIKNAEMWEKVEYLLNKNESWTVSDDTHKWKVWMQEEMKNGGQRNVG